MALPEQPRRPWALAMLAATMAFWASTWVVARAIRDDVTPIGLNFWRWLLAFAVLLPLAWQQIRVHAAALRAQWPVLAILAALGIAAFNVTIYKALQSTTATNGVLIVSSAPVVIALFAWLLLRERFRPRQAVGVTLSLLGVLTLVSHGDPGRLLATEFNPGDLWSLLLVPLWSAYTLLLRLCRPGVPPLALLTVLAGLGVLEMLPVYLWVEAGGVALHLTPAVGLGIVYMAVFPSVLGYAFYNVGVAAIGAGAAAPFLHLVPLLTAGFAWLLLGEALLPYHLVAAALVLGGVTLTTR